VSERDLKKLEFVWVRGALKILYFKILNMQTQFCSENWNYLTKVPSDFNSLFLSRNLYRRNGKVGTNKKWGKVRQLLKNKTTVSLCPMFHSFPLPPSLKMLTHGLKKMRNWRVDMKMRNTPLRSPECFSGKHNRFPQKYCVWFSSIKAHRKH
jgi:hypothetical protein